jgi:hypothetical protein
MKSPLFVLHLDPHCGWVKPELNPSAISPGRSGQAANMQATPLTRPDP